MVFIMLVALFVALVWFFINRASVRANEQIRLLQEIVEQQRQQTALLKALVPVPPPSPASETPPLREAEPEVDLDSFNVIPER